MHGRIVTLRSLVVSEKVYLKNGNVSGVPGGVEAESHFLVVDSGNHTVAFYNVYHQRYLRMQGDILGTSVYMNLGTNVKPPDLRPNATFTEESVAPLRFKLQDLGSGEVAIVGAVSGHFVHMTAGFDLLGSDRFQPSTLDRFVMRTLVPTRQVFWVELRCRSPRHPKPGVVPFWITMAPVVPGGPAPDYARLFEYVPGPALADVRPNLVPHHFSQKQSVTVRLATLVGMNDVSVRRVPEMPAFNELFPGAVITLTSQISGLHLCIDDAPGSQPPAAGNCSSRPCNQSAAGGETLASLSAGGCDNATRFRVLREGSRGLLLHSLQHERYLQADHAGTVTAGPEASDGSHFSFVDLGHGNVAIYH